MLASSFSGLRRSTRGRFRSIVALSALMLLPTTLAAQTTDKAAEDPTKIATKAGVSYSGDATISGSLAVGPKFKFNARISEGGQWSVGASYLFPIAILTFAASKSEFDDGSLQTRYSLGGFVPCKSLGVDTGKWQAFVPFGYTHTDAENSVTDVELDETIIVEMSSKSAYVGLSGIRPLNDRMTLMAHGVVSKGSDDFSGVALGVGSSYHLTPSDRITAFGRYVDNSFGAKQKLGISYQHEF
ncbi:hypothetical protein ACHFJ0_00255 [Paracoccus sp. NGMCC 1.201697]|uniref:Transporter n=1 Tax=Paracoccus broussonetiae subsp. drimophilus TaxID=3373869 RepID=A0ABW7LE75_9RHOB